jgi:Na+-transporting NADH:ubiquinone oxidoreductase subunit A
MGTREPFEPEPSVYLSGQEALFQFGIRVLQRLATHVAVILPSGYGAPAFLKAMATHGVTGNYPCGDPGVFVYRTKTHPNQNGSWYIRGQDVLLLARLLREGRYPTERTVVSAGPEAGHPCHVATRMGAPLGHIVQPFDSTGARRFIVGGLFTGYPESVDGHLGFQETAVAVLSGEESPEMWALFKPGYHKPSYTRAFLSRLNTRPLYVDSRYHGEARACIGCGYCAEVCPVDIFPQFTYKAAVVGEMEEALEHGVLECVECGLCSHVCPSKIDLAQSFKTARADLYQERVRR